MIIRRQAKRAVRVGDRTIGGRAPILVQSMTKTDTRDVPGTLTEIRRLARVGCELVRVAVPDDAAARAFAEIKKKSPLPLVADIHFRHTLALACIAAGADKIRVNPGNIGPRWKLRAVIAAARDAGIPIRVGINTGSLGRVVRRPGLGQEKAVLESLERTLEVFDEAAFQDIVVSAKAPDVPTTVGIYRAISHRFPYALHLGLTEAGLAFEGAIRSTAALALLLAEGIGDTIRVSLAADPVWEVKAGYEILRSLGLRTHGPLLVVCPTCGRCEVDLLRLAHQVERRLQRVGTPLTVAVMGCAVNGPGEARQADYGIAAGRRQGLVFARGKIVRKVREVDLADALFDELEQDARCKIRDAR